MDLRPLKLAQQLLDGMVDERGVIEELRRQYRISFVDAAAAVAAARTLTRHGIEVRA